MKFKKGHFVFGAGLIIVMICIASWNSCVQRAEAKTSTVDSSCIKGIIWAKNEIKQGRYEVYIPGLSKELSPYAEEVFYVVYKKEVSVTNHYLPMCGVMSKEAVCHDHYMDSIVQSFGPRVYERIRNDAESLWRKDPSRYSAEHYEIAHFPGGDSAFGTFLKREIKYPATAKRDSVQGKVYIRLDVDSTGNITGKSVARSVRNDLDSAALAAMNNLPLFNPGFERGHHVKSSMIVPVSFLLK